MSHEAQIFMGGSCDYHIVEASLHIQYQEYMTFAQIVKHRTSVQVWLVLKREKLFQFNIREAEPKFLHGLTVGDKYNWHLPHRVALLNNTLL